MKKIVYVIATVAVSAFATACGSKSCGMGEAEKAASDISEVNPSELADATDSLSYYLGFNEGSAVVLNEASIPEQLRPNFHFNDYLTGVTAVLTSDTTNLGYIDGLSEGMRLLQVVLNLEDQGIKVNRQILLDAMYNSLMSDSIAPEATAKAEANLDSLFNEVRMKLALQSGAQH